MDYKKMVVKPDENAESGLTVETWGISDRDPQAVSISDPSAMP